MIRIIFVLMMSFFVFTTPAIAGESHTSNPLAEIIKAQTDMHEYALLAGFHLSRLEGIESRTAETEEDMYVVMETFFRGTSYVNKTEQAEARCRRLCEVYEFDPEHFCSLETLKNSMLEQ